MNNESTKIITIFAKMLAFMSVKVVNLLVFLVFYISPILLIVSFYFYIKSIGYAGEIPESGIIDNRYFIIFLYLISILFIDLLLIVIKNTDKILYNVKSLLPKQEEIEEIEKFNIKKFKFNGLKLFYDNDESVPLFLSIIFTTNAEGANNLNYKVLFENDKTKKIFQNVIVEKIDNSLKIDLKFRDIKIKHDKKALEKLFGSLVSICIFNEKSKDSAMPSFTIKLNKEKYEKINNDSE